MDLVDTADSTHTGGCNAEYLIAPVLLQSVVARIGIVMFYGVHVCLYLTLLLYLTVR